MYKTFTRTWWANNPSWPNGLEPCVGRKTYQGNYETEQEARDACQEYNDTHDAGRLTKKMEYDLA